MNSAVLWPSNGFKKSSLIVTLEPGDVSVISMRPSPALLLPAHAYTAPLPLAAPEKVLSIAGSSFSQGDQEAQRWKSLMRSKIFSGGAWMLLARSTRNYLSCPRGRGSPGATQEAGGWRCWRG